ncbi:MULTISPECIES: YolD-like family protein [Halanaerobium]|jgi:ribonuclease BN (tRNA processing enzyme)|uniref:YolD-like protein n=1 Tax=Halanaerobium kushneri TaxID=56779 RepID=A0A1N7AM62_9FIRM|nr:MULTISPECIES: YolD-like family protein [Halanaerobium]RCW57457.1 YolD-like protein [Halanaerobium sp. ST460_2HS_T2]SIR40169.1 YolD-like protein [Halanaerobium kushneri]
MNFKDRGNKKWNSLMLVEHQKRLKELKNRESDLKKPVLDQQQLREFNFKITKALNQNLILRVKYYEDKRIKNIEGKILKIEKYKQQIKIELLNKKIKKLQFTQIINLEL